MRKLILALALVALAGPAWAAQRFTTAANVAIGTIDDSGNIVAVGSITSPSTMTAAYIVGQGASISSYSVAVSSEPTGYPNPMRTTYIAVASATAVLRGGRPVFVCGDIYITNTNSNATPWTSRFTIDSVTINDDHVESVAVAQSGRIGGCVMFASGFTAGTRVFAFLFKGAASTALTCVITDVHFSVQEF
jgi:hypothetical protein